MKYKILKGVLIAGVVLGFGSGFASLGARWAMHCKDGRGHCADSCSEGSRWARKHGREVAPPAVSPESRPGAATMAPSTTPPAPPAPPAL